jgi:NAD(P)H-hydrate epimerase
MDVLYAAEMQICDRLTAEQYQLHSLDLMRWAASAVADFTRAQFPLARRVTVVCGHGNNGGDGMLAARMLASAGLEVTTLLVGLPDGLKGDAAAAWAELTTQKSGAAPNRVHILASAEDLPRYAGNLAQDCDLIVDAVLGTGFKPPLRGLALAALDWIDASRLPVLAVDLPSGWEADETGAAARGPHYPADAVITFIAPKPAHVFGHLTRRWNQPVVLKPFNSREPVAVAELGAASPRLRWAGSSLALAQSPRAANANKGNFGHVLVVGGSVGKSGAPAMTSLAALRSGAGLVTAAIPAPVLPMVASVAPELMTWPLAAGPGGCIASENLASESLSALMAGKTVLAIGPGLGQSPETVKFTLGLLSATKIPAVIDADALNILAAGPELAAGLAKMTKDGRTTVLTPHPGEMARMAGVTVAEVQANRLEVARGFAQKAGVMLVLKGARTLIAHPDGRIAVNTSGNPGMAKGGSGDLLTGLIAGLLAQHPAEAAQAVEAAVYLHGLAADLAVRAGDEHTLLATDCLHHLARAFRSQAFDFRACGPSRYLWLQGLPPEIEPFAAIYEALP